MSGLVFSVSGLPTPGMTTGSATPSTSRSTAVPGSSSAREAASASENTLTNTGPAPWTKTGGLLSLWVLGMFPFIFAAVLSWMEEGFYDVDVHSLDVKELYRDANSLNDHAGPLLPGHGETPAALNKTCWQDWYNAMETAFLEL